MPQDDPINPTVPAIDPNAGMPTIPVDPTIPPPPVAPVEPVAPQVPEPVVPTIPEPVAPVTPEPTVGEQPVVPPTI